MYSLLEKEQRLILCLAYLVHYSPSKNRIHGLVSGLRVDLKGTDVHTTEIQPDPVATNFGASSGGSDSSQDFANNNPLSRVEITPQQCAKESLVALRSNKLLFPRSWLPLTDSPD